MRCRIIRKNQYVLVTFMRKIIADAFFLHESRNEIQVCFTILHTIVAFREVAIQTQFEILETQVRENLLDDLGDFFILENPAICCPREEPKPRDDLRAISCEPAILRPLSEPADKSIPMALSAIRIEDAKRDILSDDVAKLYRIAL